MGEAKRRGSFEDRKKEAEASKKKPGFFQRNTKTAVSKRGRKIISLLAAAMMMVPFK